MSDCDRWLTMRAIRHSITLSIGNRIPGRTFNIVSVTMLRGQKRPNAIKVSRRVGAR